MTLEDGRAAGEECRVRSPPAGEGLERDAGQMSVHREGILERFVLAGAGFERTLRLVAPGQWSHPTPCTEWDVRSLVNHMTRGNLNYMHLLDGGTAAEFLRLRDVDALGSDPVDAFTGSVTACAAAFAEPGALRRRLDYPLGRASGAQLLAVRTTDTVIHTWDLARATGTDETLDSSLVSWITENLAEIYSGLSETPTDRNTTNRFFAVPTETRPSGKASAQDLLLRRMGRTPYR
jgi:uncharacterized protein (TIGR03086 family)